MARPAPYHRLGLREKQRLALARARPLELVRCSGCGVQLEQRHVGNHASRCPGVPVVRTRR